MNPMKIMNAFNTFRNNHPKVVQFAQVVFGSGVEEGTVIEVSVTKPGEEKITTNMKIKKSDIELFDELKNMGM
ncbi:MAG: hypothetical protein K5644_05165 [Lachnospiraceae bacterium]|nr:hypothetical protein [Lachnospiraceae bacterium]